MNLFRSVLFWLLLAVLGALLAQVLLQDPGYVLVRYRGSDYTTTVAAGIGILLATLFAIVLLWDYVVPKLQVRAALRAARLRASRAAARNTPTELQR